MCVPQKMQIFMSHLVFRRQPPEFLTSQKIRLMNLNLSSWQKQDKNLENKFWNCWLTSIWQEYSNTNKFAQINYIWSDFGITGMVKEFFTCNKYDITKTLGLMQVCMKIDYYKSPQVYQIWNQLSYFWISHNMQ